MKFRLLNIIALTSLGYLPFTSCTTQATDNELKVMEWNIWHGGHSKTFPEEGCKGALGLIKETNPDIFLVIETYGASHQIADELEFYHRLLSSNLSIYSRYPIIKTYDFSDKIGNFNFGGLMINKNGQKIRIFDTWLNCYPDSRLAPTAEGADAVLAWEKAGSRDDEINKILGAIKPFLAETDSIPIIMAGDFNIHSHLDWTEATKDMYNHGGTVVEWPVSKAMETAGFIDSYRKIHPDPVQQLGTSWKYGQGGVVEPTVELRKQKSTRQDRIDYIYYKGSSLEAIQSECHYSTVGDKIIYHGQEFFYPSDHGFLVTTFKHH